MHQVVTRIQTLNAVARKTLTRISKSKRALTCSKCRIELSNLVIYIGVMVGEGCIKFQCNASSKYRDMDS